LQSAFHRATPTAALRRPAFREILQFGPGQTRTKAAAQMIDPQRLSFASVPKLAQSDGVPSEARQFSISKLRSGSLMRLSPAQKFVVDGGILSCVIASPL
jgi:hypothetical protein